MSVVLIVADTLRRDRMSTYGALRPTMPRLDARMDHAIRADRVFATSNWTLPSTASILTGALPERTAIDFSVNATDFYETYELEGSTLVPELVSAGRRAALFSGNLGLDFVVGLEEGFDAFEFVAIGEQGTSEPIVNRALEWVDEADEPFFLYLQPFDTHFPYLPPDAVLGTFRDPTTLPFDLTEEAQRAALDQYRRSDRVAHPETLRALLDLYDEELVFLDLQIDRLLVGLEERGWMDDTLVVLTSDHGELFDDNDSNLFFHGVSLRPGVNVVPLLFYAPHLDPAISDVLVSGADVLPTVFSLVGEAVPDSADGTSMFATTPRTLAYTWDPVGVGWGDEVPPMAALTDGRWKVSRECPGVVRGYDLLKDPNEARAFDPLALPETATLLGELRTQMRELHPECP